MAGRNKKAKSKSKKAKSAKSTRASSKKAAGKKAPVKTKKRKASASKRAKASRPATTKKAKKTVAGRSSSASAQRKKKAVKKKAAAKKVAKRAAPKPAKKRKKEPAKTSHRPQPKKAATPSRKSTAKAKRKPAAARPRRSPRPSLAERERLKKAQELRQSEDRQTNLYDKAVKYFNARRFAKALPYFRKVAEGPHPTLRHRARIHAEICRRQKESEKVRLKTAEDHYNYGVQLMNERRLEEAGRHLDRALKMQPKAGHIHFAAAVLGALSGDKTGSYKSLKRAIELDPQNRVLALHDTDLAGVLNEPSIAELLHEESNTS